MPLTEEEKDLNNCLDKIFTYCKEHKGDCRGCIFYRQITTIIGRVAYCRVMYDPDTFNK